jgi:nucleotide-binding universal stress UspA family protein
VLYGAEVAESLVHQANSVLASFLAMAVHPHRGLERLTSGNVCMKTVARAPCPVLAVPIERADRAG